MIRRLGLGVIGGLIVWAGVFVLGFDVAHWIGQAFVRTVTCTYQPSHGIHCVSYPTRLERWLRPVLVPLELDGELARYNVRAMEGS